MTGNIRNVVVPDAVDLDKRFYSEPHEVIITSSKDQKMTADSGTITVETVDSYDNKIQCQECTEFFDDRRDARKHIEETREKNRTHQVASDLEGLGIHGFTVSGCSGHGTSIRMPHQDLGLTVLVSRDEDELIIGLYGDAGTEFERYNGTVQERVKMNPPYTYSDIITDVRDFIEEKLTDIDSQEVE